MNYLIQELIGDFVKELESRQYKASTLKAYKTDLLALEQYLVIEQIPLEKIQRNLLLSWLKSNYPNRSAQRKAVNIRQFILWYMPDSSIWQNTWNFADYQRQDQLYRDFSLEQLAHLLTIEQIPLYLRCIWSMIIYMALSLGEILNLQYKHIHQDRIIIQDHLGKQRMLQLDQYTYALISKYLSQQPIKFNQDQQLFTQDIEISAMHEYILNKIKYYLVKYLKIEASYEDLHYWAVSRLQPSPQSLQLTGKSNFYNLSLHDHLEINAELIHRLKRLHQGAFN